MTEFDLIWTDEEKQEAEKEAYNQALEDFETALLDGEQSEEFIYSIKEIVERLRK